MRRAIIGVIALAVVSLGAVQAANAVSSRTPTDVKNLLQKEEVLVTTLKNYAPTAKWKAAYTSELSTQNHAAAIVTGDLAASSSPKPSTNTAISTDENGNKVEVTLLAVFDPASWSSATGFPPNAGYRYVGIEYKLTDISKHTESDSADNDASVVGSNDEVYTTDLDSITECTDFNDGQWSLSPGTSVIGCSTFQIPNGVKVAKFDFDASEGNGGRVANFAIHE